MSLAEQVQSVPVASLMVNNNPLVPFHKLLRVATKIALGVATAAALAVVLSNIAEEVQVAVQGQAAMFVQQCPGEVPLAQ